MNDQLSESSLPFTPPMPGLARRGTRPPSAQTSLLTLRNCSRSPGRSDHSVQRPPAISRIRLALAVGLPLLAVVSGHLIGDRLEMPGLAILVWMTAILFVLTGFAFPSGVDRIWHMLMGIAPAVRRARRRVAPRRAGPAPRRRIARLHGTFGSKRLTRIGHPRR